MVLAHYLSTLLFFFFCDINFRKLELFFQIGHKSMPFKTKFMVVSNKSTS